MALATTGNAPLVQLALASFHTLTRAERAMLEFAELDNVDRGAIAVCGTSSNPADPSNDPKNAGGWGAERNIRAGLIEWLCLNPRINALVYPKGIRIMGARIVGGLDLSQARVPFAIVMHNCSISERIRLAATDIPYLELDGSYVGEIDAPGINVRNDMSLSTGFHASGEVDLHGAVIGGDLECVGGHFTHSPVDLFNPKNTDRRALDCNDMRVRGIVGFCCGEETGGFRADGEVQISGSIGGDLFLDGRFSNPGKPAIFAVGADIGGNVLIGFSSSFESDGLVSFVTARVGTNFVVNQGTFSGRTGDRHGLDASGISVKNLFLWHNVALRNGAILNLTGASAQALQDDEASWPKPGNLIIDGFTYSGLGPPTDAPSRLRWLSLQPSGVHLQPYRQLAKFLRESGDEPGAIQVLVAQEDARYASSGLMGAMLGRFLNATIGYGHRPLRTILWALSMIVIGWGVVVMGKRAGVMRPTWPENASPRSEDVYEGLHPLLYSADVFFPFVNFHQEHYWWPNAETAGELSIFGRRFRVSGALVRYYLWFQIAAGWLLSAIFLAGISGLLRND